MNLMLDVETLSTEPNAMVFEVALVPFSDAGEIFSPDHLFAKFQPETGHISPDTVHWWLKHSSTCSLGCSTMSESDAAGYIYGYLERHSGYRLWAMPTSFDCVILEQMLARNGHGPKLPIDYHLWRDVTTTRDLAGFPKVDKRSGHVAHNAFCDCLRQIDLLVESWRQLRREI